MITPDAFIKDLNRKITKQDMAAFVSTLVAGFLAHGYMFFNKLANGDDLVCWRGNGGGPISQGRWMKAILENYRMDLVGDYSTPWSKGYVSVLLFAIAAVVIIRLFQVESPVFAGLIGGMLVTFPTVGMAFYFMYMSDAIAIACLFTCLSAFLIARKPWKRKLSILAGIFLGACAVGTYQAYFALLATLLLSVLLADCYKGKFENLKEWLLTGLYYIGTMAGSMVLYFIIHKVLTTVKHITVLEMHGSRMGEISPAALPDVFSHMYSCFMDLFRTDYLGIGASVLVRGAMVVLVATVLWLMIQKSIFLVKEQKVSMVVAMWITTVIYPMALNMIFLMVPLAMDTVYILMTHSLCFVFILPLLIADHKESGGLVRWITTLVVAWSVLYYAHFSNEAYLYREMAYAEAQGYYISLIAQIKSADDYDASMPVVLIGESEDPTLYDLTKQYRNLQRFLGDIDTKNPLVGNDLSRYFMAEYCGFAPEYAEQTDLSGEQKKVLKDMPLYPNAGSIQVVDGMVLVKYSDVK
ncbi:MAG: glucosyltransferase domain-containing protein [Lachnospiraceae bacterium]|nr:glucosyltransferase domain-containing protein [Lachnospiraceae bacterium]